MFNLENILKLIHDGLTNSAFAQQNRVVHEGNQVGLPVLSKPGNQVDALGKQCLEQGLGDIALIAIEFAEQLLDETTVLERGSVVGIAWG